MPRAAGTLEELARLPGTLVAGWRNAFVQVRRGELTEETFDRVAAAMRRHRVRQPRELVHGVLAIVEEGAPIAGDAVRTKQRATVADVLKDPLIRFATVIVGDGIEASLLRSASRGVVPSHPHLRLFAQPHEACAWLAPELGVDATELAQIVEVCRARVTDDD